MIVKAINIFANDNECIAVRGADGWVDPFGGTFSPEMVTFLDQVAKGCCSYGYVDGTGEFDAAHVVVEF